jgi:tetratricopeptide (TPR) repeat protein
VVTKRLLKDVGIGALLGLLVLMVWTSRRAPVVPAVPRLGSPGAPQTSREDLAYTVAAMEARLESNHEDRSAAVTLAEALLRQSRVSGNVGLAVRAEEVVRKALAQEPLDYEARRMLATVLASQHRFREALGEAERAMRERPRDSWTQGVIADARMELGDYEEAFAAVDRMMELHPDAAAYARASYAREIQGDLAAAAAFMQMAAEATSAHDPESLAWQYAQLGHLYLQAGSLSEARRRFAQADAIFPAHPFATSGLAQVANYAGNYEEALTIGSRAFESAPTPDLALQLAHAARALGRTEDADRYDALAEQMWRDDMPDPVALARLLADRGRNLDEAVESARRARESRRDIFTEDALAWALFKSGRIDEAREAMDRALRTGTRDRVIRAHAAAIEAAMAGQ